MQPAGTEELHRPEDRRHGGMQEPMGLGTEGMQGRPMGMQTGQADSGTLVSRLFRRSFGGRH